MSIYPLDRNRRYQTPGTVVIEPYGAASWQLSSGGIWDEEELQSIFGESLTPVVEMTEVTVEFDDEANIEGNIYIGWSTNRHAPLLQPGTTANFILTMRYPQGSELNSAKDDK